MRPFLLEVAETLTKHNRKPEEYTIIFPNQRSILYFRKYFSQFFNKPVFGPELLTLEEFAARFVNRRVPDQLTLIYLLFKVHRQVTGWHEPFEAFYFWGSMLLRDFDELDKYLIEPEHIFKDLSNLEELNQVFDYLTEEQKRFLSDFWAGYAMATDEFKKQFSAVWKLLPSVYAAFNETLNQEGLTYEGRLYKDAAHAVAQQAAMATHLVFVGFNALTPAQQQLMVHAVLQWNAQVFWDVDDYYVNSEWQEAGMFFRQYRLHPVLARTFPAEMPAHFQKQRRVKIYGSPHAVGQAKILAEVLNEALQNGMKPEEAVIVLPDEKMLLPVLHAVSDAVSKLNVSVSYPLALTPIPALIEQLAELHQQYRKGSFYGGAVLSVLAHPYIRALYPLQNLYQQINRNNQLYLPAEAFGYDAFFKIIFKPEPEICPYLEAVLSHLHQHEKISPLDREYIMQTLRLITQLAEIPEATATWKALMPLFRQLVRVTRIPFVGEPLEGLPVIGMLETRNLDFRHVFLLSVNEGALPPFARSGSYLPYSVRKAYGLPVAGHDESISAYLFYRLMQRAETVTLFYTTEPDELGRGEMSRFLQQLLLETEPRPEPVLVNHILKPQPVHPIVVEKSDEVWQQLIKWLPVNEGNRYLSPTALITYRECRLKFYFRYVLNLKEPDELEEQISARTAGKILHRALQLFYDRLTDQKNGSTFIERQDLENPEQRLNEALFLAMREEFSIPEAVAAEPNGNHLIMKKVLERFALRILELDRAYAPFELLAQEHNEYRYHLNVHGYHTRLLLGGRIDRMDRKNNTVRIIDYKTGGDETEWKDSTIEDLFNREKELKKSIFQTLLYALLYVRNNPHDANSNVMPGIMGRRQIFNKDFTFGLKDDVRSELENFEAELARLAGELLDRQVPFDQTKLNKVCAYCSFKGICYR